MNICFASRNTGKIKEINALFPSGFSIYGLKEFPEIGDIEETGSTLAENAAIKAAAVYDQFKVPVFADDSGLFVEALNGEPGIYSARYAGEAKNDQANIDKLLAELADKTHRAAAFKTNICYIDHNGVKHFFEGEAKGTIISNQKGDNGFGYDPVFVPEGHDRTFAELSAKEKNSISHRYKAIDKLIAYLANA